ncbi:MAG: CDP-glycerol glycerophosphotransferase family protein [Candidatus Paceibacterota bacterium]
MKTIFLFIYHHSHISDLLNTKYIEYLSSKYKIVVILPKREGETSAKSGNYFKNNNIEYEEYSMVNVKWWYRFKLLRASCVRKFDYLLHSKINYTRNKSKDERRIVLRIISRLLPMKFTDPKVFTFLEKIFTKKSKQFDEYVKKYKPSLILTATPGFTFFEAEVIILAKKAKIPTTAINFTWDNLTSNGKLIRKTDYLIVWNNIIKKEAKDFHNYPLENVFISGSLRFDCYFEKMNGELKKEEFLKSKNLDPKLKTIFIATMSQNNYPAHTELIEDILKFRDEKKIKENVNIFVRVHPKDSVSLYEHLIDKNIKNFHIEIAGTQIKKDGAKGQKIQMDEEDILNLKNTLMNIDISINPFSTMSLESMIFDKPVINIGLIKEYRPALYYLHYKPLLDAKSVRVAFDKRQLVKHINAYLENPKLDSDNRKKIVNDFVCFTDGLSYKRNVDFLDEILKR